MEKHPEIILGILINAHDSAPYILEFVFANRQLPKRKIFQTAIYLRVFHHLTLREFLLAA